MTKSSAGEDMTYLAYTSRHWPSLRETRADRQEPEAETVEEHCWWTLRAPCPASYTYHIAQDHQPRVGAAHSGHSPPTSINNQNNPSQVRHSDLGYHLNETSFSDDSRLMLP